MDTAYTKPQKSLLSRAVSYLQQNFIRAVGVIIILFIFWRIIYVAGQTSYTPQYWTSQLFNGLVLGGVYALIALGYTLVYGILFMINFAHG
jgi:branched-chain amino acid transport system permease protein